MNHITYAQRIREMSDEELAECFLSMIITYTQALGVDLDDHTDNTVATVRYTLINQLRSPYDEDMENIGVGGDSYD